MPFVYQKYRNPSRGVLGGQFESSRAQMSEAKRAGLDGPRAKFIPLFR